MSALTPDSKFGKIRSPNDIQVPKSSVLDNLGVGIKQGFEETTLAWSAKETIYKLHQNGGIDYKSDIKIKEINFVKNQITVLFQDNDIVLNYNKLNNHFLVYVCI